MQDRFVGDVGDFANHGILRALCGTPAKPVDGLKLGVVEYFNGPTGADLGKSHGNGSDILKSQNTTTQRIRCVIQSSMPLFESWWVRA